MAQFRPLSSAKEAGLTTKGAIMSDSANPRLPDVDHQLPTCLAIPMLLGSDLP